MLLVSIINVNAQFGTSSESATISGLEIRLTNIEYTGRDRQFFKPSIGYEFLVVMGDKESKLNGGIGIGFTPLSTKTDTFPTYYTISTGSKVNIVSQKTVITNPRQAMLSLFLEYKFLNKKLSPLLDVSSNLELLFYDYHDDNSGSNESIFQGGLTPKIGLIYELNSSLGFKIKTGQALLRNSYKVWTRYWNTSISLIKYI